MQQPLGEPHDLGAPELALPVDPVHEGDGHLAHGISVLPGANQHLHLEDVAARGAGLHQRLQHRLLVQPEEGKRKRGCKMN